jgi:hypothetical protein
VADAVAPPLAYRLAASLVSSLFLFVLVSFFAWRHVRSDIVKPWKRPSGGAGAAGRPRTAIGWIGFASLGVLFYVILMLLPVVPTIALPGARPEARLAVGDFLPGLIPWALMLSLLFGLSRSARGDKAIRKSWEALLPFHGRCRLEVSPDGVVIAGPLARHEFHWAYFVGFRELPELFLLYSSPLVYWIIPKRAFPSPDQLDAFKGLLLTHVVHGQLLQPAGPGAFPVTPFAAVARPADVAAPPPLPGPPPGR